MTRNGITVLRTGHSLDQAEEFAALYALGTLVGDEASAYEQHVQEGCAVCQSQLREMEVTTGLLGSLAPAEEPPPDLKNKLFDRVGLAESTATAGPQVWKTWKGDGDGPETPPEGSSFVSVRADEGAWEETGISGIAVRRLHLDTQREMVTMMVRMTPGTAYLPHRHRTAEECFVLQGDLHVGDEVLHAGDYQRAEAGSIHGVQSTEGGCTLLIMSSTRDELLG